MTTAIKSLQRKQKKHAAMLVKVENTSARLDRRKLKLIELETAIAALEGSLAEPRKRRSAKGEALQGTRHAQLIFNPTSGRDDEDNAQRLAQIIKSLKAHGIEANIGLKTSGQAARSLARDAARDGAPLVIVAAGDGTIADVAGELIGTSTTLALVPIGTMNNIARSLGIPLDIDAACALIGMGTTRHIDIGRVHTDQSAEDEYFLECAGIGLAAIVAMAGQSFEKRRWRALPRSLQRIFEAKPGTIRIELDGTIVDASTRLVTVCNAPLMGNNLLAAPEAKMDDGLLDVSVYDRMGDAALVGHFLAASAHTPDELKIYRARRVRITSQTTVPANSDRAAAPKATVVEIEVVPAAVTMIVGNGIGLTMPVESAPSAPTFASAPTFVPAPPSTNGEATVEADDLLPTTHHA